LGEGIAGTILPLKLNIMDEAEQELLEALLEMHLDQVSDY
jgi:hypothetical protein